MTKQSFTVQFILLLIMPIFVISDTLNSQRLTLLTIKQQWGNLPAFSTWKPATSPCSWTGIKCSGGPGDSNSTRVVTGISLYNFEINSLIPSSICDLKTLKNLNLSWNYIPGSFPTALSRCSALTHLDLSENLFVGPIPDDVDKLLPPSLQYLNLNENNFTGTIPKSIGGLKELKTLYLINNLLNGTYPYEISNLSKLEDLQIAYNPFTPMALPPEWGKLKNLRYLFMRECNLVGKIPESFGGFVSLEHLDLAANGIVGGIPDAFFLLKSLKNLYLFSNELSGEIPKIVHALNLTEIDLSFNNLKGSIPKDFDKLKKLKVLAFYNNQLSGEIPASIGLLPLLEDLNLNGNNLSGPLPPQLGLYSTFQYLEIMDNQFSGPLPENLCSRGALIGITASLNNLSGEIPKSLGNCTTLQTLIIFNNRFTGEVPPGFWTLPRLYAISFSFNGFTGHLPNRIADNMTNFEVSYNKFTGQIPAGIASWKNIRVLLAANNMLSGTVPSGLTSLSRLNTLTLEGNQLSGELPLKMDSWASLETLSLSRNKFSGPIPAIIGSLPKLTQLDLSRNDLSGEIPSEFENLELTFLDLSNNKLSGKIPSSLDKTAFVQSFFNNTNLCTIDRYQILMLPRCSSSLDTFSSKHLSSKKMAMIIVFVGIIFSVIICIIVFAITKNKRKKQIDELPSWEFTLFQRVEFSEVNIISNLTEQHVIGSGGSGKVYQVQVGNPGYFVAVKKIWNNNQLNNAQFLAEVNILGNIRHANIVKLLCCISNEKTKLLVYEYLENQSLDRWLHKRRRLALERRGEPLHVLDWPTRLRIAISVARGLCYMHHDCAPPIIHRDIKSSNILLDSDFNAKIADFGLARITVKQGELYTMSSVAGTFGYLAPEYRNARKVNEKIDVYSFGVVLLELATGKEPNSRDETLNLADSSWRHYCEDKLIVDWLDMEVMQEDYQEEMTMVFKLGLMCTSPSPNSRPSMKEVLQVLCRNNPLQVRDGGN